MVVVAVASDSLLKRRQPDFLFKKKHASQDGETDGGKKERTL
jgi:hypothetical protein